MIAIAGYMPMPKNCMECRFRNQNGECSFDTYMPIDTFDKRPDWCRLREIATIRHSWFYTREDVNRFGKEILEREGKRLSIQEIANTLKNENMITFRETLPDENDENIPPEYRKIVFESFLNVVIMKGEQKCDKRC